MSLYYYKTEVGNIGDDLNEWLWKDLFDLNKVNDESILIGFGSILTSNLTALGEKPISSYKNKIILGAGVRSIDNLPEIDSSWDVSFLRGPISSLFLTNNLSNYITDGAYALRHHSSFQEIMSVEKKYDVAFMPYLRTSNLIPWEKICADLNIHYISPHSTDDIKKTLMEISASKRIVTEAMHGAILADICRVPWSKAQFAADIFEGGSVNATKWNDWSRSIGVNFNTTELIRFPKKYTYIPKVLMYYIRWKKKSICRNVKQQLENMIADGATHLSGDDRIKEIDEKIASKIDDLRQRLYGQ